MATAPLRSKVKDKARKQLWDSLLEVYEKEADKEYVADCEEVNVTELEKWTLSHPNGCLRALPQVAKANPELVCTALAGNEVSPPIKNARKRRPEETDDLEVEIAAKAKKVKTIIITSKPNVKKPSIPEKSKPTSSFGKSTCKLKSSLDAELSMNNKENTKKSKSRDKLLKTDFIEQKLNKNVIQRKDNKNEPLITKKTEETSCIGRSTCKLNSSLSAEPSPNPKRNRKNKKKIEGQLLETNYIVQKGKKCIKDSKSSTNKLYISKKADTSNTNGDFPCKLNYFSAAEPSVNHKKNRKKNISDDQLLKTDSIKQKEKKSINPSKASTNEHFTSKKIETTSIIRKSLCEPNSSFNGEPFINDKKKRNTGKSEKLLEKENIDQPKKNKKNIKEYAKRLKPYKKQNSDSAASPSLNIFLKNKPNEDKETLFEPGDREEVFEKKKESQRNSTISKSNKCHFSVGENIKSAVPKLPSQVKYTLPLLPSKNVGVKKKPKQNGVEKVNLKQLLDEKLEVKFPKRRVKPRASPIFNEKDEASNHKCDLKLRYYSQTNNSSSRPDGRVFSCKLIFKVCECMESDEIF